MDIRSADHESHQFFWFVGFAECSSLDGFRDDRRRGASGVYYDGYRIKEPPDHCQERIACLRISPTLEVRDAVRVNDFETLLRRV